MLNHLRKLQDDTYLSMEELMRGGRARVNAMIGGPGETLSFFRTPDYLKLKFGTWFWRQYLW